MAYHETYVCSHSTISLSHIVPDKSNDYLAQ